MCLLIYYNYLKYCALISALLMRFNKGGIFFNNQLINAHFVKNVH
jgi:hypothetical protein